MSIIKNKVAIGDEVFIIETKYSDKIANIYIYHVGADNYPLFTKENISIEHIENIEELHSRVLAKFIKTYKKNRGDMDIVNTILAKFLSFKEKDSKKSINSETTPKKEVVKKELLSNEILKSCHVYLDNDINAIIIAENENVVFIDDDNTQIDKDKILHVLKYIYNILKNNRDSIEKIVGDVSTMYIELDSCQVIVSPIYGDKVCMIIGKESSSIGNLYKKSQKIFKHSKELFKNIGE